LRRRDAALQITPAFYVAMEHLSEWLRRRKAARQSVATETSLGD
jgi:hypothetical protein